MSSIASECEKFSQLHTCADTNTHIHSVEVGSDSRNTLQMRSLIFIYSVSACFATDRTALGRQKTKAIVQCRALHHPWRLCRHQMRSSKQRLHPFRLTQTVWSMRNHHIYCSTHTTRSTGIHGATKPSKRRAKKTNRFSCPSVIRRAIGVMWWKRNRSRMSTLPKWWIDISSTLRSIARSGPTSTRFTCNSFWW